MVNKHNKTVMSNIYAQECNAQPDSKKGGTKSSKNSDTP